MAKRRRVSQTPAQIPQTESVPVPVPVPDPEPSQDPQPIKPEPTEEQEQHQEEEEEEEEEEFEESDPEEAEDEENPQALATTDPTAAAAAANGEDDDQEEESDPQSIQKLLELFPKDQLVDLLRDAAVSHPEVLKEIHRVADVDPTHRKIFVHGLGWDTTNETLTTFFTQFGEVEDCKAVIDKNTGRSKGYGFVLFKHRKAASNALKEPQKKIGSRMTACQLASAGPVPPPALPASEYTQRKIFVSNVGAEVDPQKLTQFFAKFGEIEAGPLGLDKVTGKPRGFCLYVYKTAESAKKVLEEPHKEFEGHKLHCQKAVDGPKGFKQQGGFQKKNPAGAGGGFVGHAQGAGAGHLMAPPTAVAGMGYNQQAVGAQPAAGLNPALGQALTALLASQGAGLGLGNLLGGQMVNQGQMVNNGMQGGGYGAVGGYGGQPGMQGGYGGGQVGQGSGARGGQQGYGHAAGGPPYMGHH